MTTEFRSVILSEEFACLENNDENNMLVQLRKLFLKMQVHFKEFYGKKIFNCYSEMFKTNFNENFIHRQVSYF